MKKETRMYYKIPEDLGAIIHMAINYGVEYEGDYRVTHGGTQIPIWYCEMYTDENLNFNLTYNNDDRLRVYIKKESEHIFEPKGWDNGKTRQSSIVEYRKHNPYDYNTKLNSWTRIGSSKKSDQKNVEIIIRDGKQFFMPKIEEL